MSDKIKQLIKELENKEGIANKLDHYRDQYFIKCDQDSDRLAEVLDCDTFITALKLPVEIYNKFFNPYQLSDNSKQDYYLWWMDFIAEYAPKYFPEYKRNIDELKKLRSPKKLLSDELKSIEEFEKKVEELYKKGQISFEKPSQKKYFEEQIYLKLSHDYYQTNSPMELEHQYKEIARIKAKYILAKEYLKTNLTNIKDNNKAKSLETPIIPTYYPNIYADLKKFFPKSEHAKLSSLLKGGYIEDKIHFKGQMKTIGSYFYNYKLRNWLNIDSGTKVAQWIKQNFKYVHNNYYKDFSVDKLQRWITGSKKDDSIIPPSINTNKPDQF